MVFGASWRFSGLSCMDKMSFLSFVHGVSTRLRSLAVYRVGFKELHVRLFFVFEVNELLFLSYVCVRYGS